MRTASIGCPIPDLRFVRPKKPSSTTEQPYLTFETTQIYLPEDFTTADVEYVEHVDEPISGETDDDNADRKTRYTDYNPYAYSNGDGSEVVAPGGNARGDDHHTERRNKFRTSKPKSAKHRPSTIRRRPHNQQKREVNNKFDDIFYVQSADIISQLHANINSIAYNRTTIDEDTLLNRDIYDNERLNRNANDDGHLNVNRAENRTMPTGKGRGKSIKKKIALQRAHDTDSDSDTVTDDATSIGRRQSVRKKMAKSGNGMKKSTNGNDEAMGPADGERNATNTLLRVKRKSGKAAGALSRPKGGGDTGVKSTSRKKEGKYFRPD